MNGALFVPVFFALRPGGRGYSFSSQFAHTRRELASERGARDAASIGASVRVAVMPAAGIPRNARHLHICGDHIPRLSPETRERLSRECV